MTTATSTRLGYFLRDYNSSDSGFSTFLLAKLFDDGHKEELPLLDNDYLQKLQYLEGIEMKEIRSIQNFLPNKPRGWSPTSSFLYKIFKTGHFLELGIKKDKILVSSTRKTILEILHFIRNDETKELLLKTKMKEKGYGKELRLMYNNKRAQQVYWDLIGHNKALGLKFNSYLLVSHKNKPTEKVESTLFSIHRLDIENACFVYEAEIDGIQEVNTTTVSDPAFSIVEVKTHYEEESAIKVFKEYGKMFEIMKGNATSPSVNQNLRMRDKFMKLHPKYFQSLLQGELGNVDKYIYGFPNDKQMTVREFPCHPGVLLQHELQYLRDFVELLNQSRVCCIDAGLTWDDWQEWRIIKNKNAMELWHDNELLAKLEMWK